MKSLIAILLITLSSCATLDSIGNDQSRTDSVNVLFAVESVSVDKLDDVCSQWGVVAACTTDTTAYVQGNRNEQ